MVLLLAFKDTFEVAGRSLRSRSSGMTGAVVQGRDLDMLLHHISDCRTDPASCGDAADNMANYSANMTNRVLEDINETKNDFDKLVAEAEACDMDSTGDHAVSFNTKVDTYMTCREKQSAAAKLATLCDANAGNLQSTKDLVCKSTILTTPISDVQDICKPSPHQPLGEWLESMAVQFDTKTKNFQKQQGLCNDAQLALENVTEECNTLRNNSTAQENSCDGVLRELETFSCNWASGFTTRCSAYNLCYAGVLARYTKQNSELAKEIEQWTQTWTAAKKMECTSSAISSSDVVNATKMKECNSANFTNTSFIKVKVPAMPPKQTCSEPDVYPGSKLFRSKVYGRLPADITVRLPTLCLSWKGACATYSTFAGSAVFLKNHDGKFCHINNKQMYCDGSSKGLFAFEHKEGKTSCTGSAELTSVHSDQLLKCRFDHSAPAPQYMACGPAATGDPPAEIVIATNPLPSGRSGNVRFEFKGKTGQPVPWGVASEWGSWGRTATQQEKGWTESCKDFSLIANGGFKSIRYKYAKNSYNVALMDMVYSFVKYEPGEKEPIWLTNSNLAPELPVKHNQLQPRGLTNGPPQMICEPNHVLVAIESEIGYGSGALTTKYVQVRTWTWSCAAASEGLTISGSFGPFPNQAWGSSDCGPNGYVTGVEGKYCPQCTTGSGSDPYGVGPNYNAWGLTQMRVMCGSLSFAKPLPIEITVEYSSALP